MFGIVKTIEYKYEEINITIVGNDRKFYYFSWNGGKLPLNIRNIKEYSRVVFENNHGAKILYLKRASTERCFGSVIYTFTDTSGLIKLSTSEIVRYSNHNLYMEQKVKVTPIETYDEEMFLAGCKDIISYDTERLTDDIRVKAETILHKCFARNSEWSFDAVIDSLGKAGISMERFGFRDKRLFLEQFSLALRLFDNREKALIIGEEDISPHYNTARMLLKKQGYDDMTLLQRRVFSDPSFWNNNRTMILGSTSSGKTAIAFAKYQMDLEQAIKNSSEKPKLLIAVNLRTLVTQFQKIIQKRLSPHYDLSVMISTSEYLSDDDDIRQGNTDIAIVIYEKLFIFASKDNSIFSHYTHFIIDEAAIVSDEERGAKADVVVSKACEFTELKINILGTPYYRWDGYINNYNFYPITICSRPVPVYEYFIYPKKYKERNQYYCLDSYGDSIHLSKPQSWKNTLFTLCENEFNAGHTTMVFFFSQKQTKEYSEKLYLHFKEIFSWSDIPKDELNAFIRKFIKNYDLSFEELKGYLDTDAEFEALYHGIAFHNASLPEKLRIAIESEFLDKSRVTKQGIRIVLSTNTLAYGINSNVDTVILAQMQRHTTNEQKNISFNEYQNCIGRSGRLGFSNCGRSYAFLPDDFEEKYFNAKPDTMKIPVKTMRFYTGKNTNAIDFLYGRLGQITSEGNADLLAFYLLSLFKEGELLTAEILTEHLGRISMPDDIDKKSLSDTVSCALELLEKNKMIRYGCLEELNPFDDDNEYGYFLTKHGKIFQGYALSVSDFLKLTSFPDILVVDDEIHVFDYFLSLMDLEEFLKKTHNMLMKYENDETKKNKNPENDEINKNNAYMQTDAAYRLIAKMLPIFSEKKWISKEKYKTVQQFIEKPEKYYELSEEDFFKLRAYRTATVITMWISGCNISLISEMQGVEEHNIDNIRRRLGEKVSYYTDVIRDIAKDKMYDLVIQQKIQQLSYCLFYGIRYEWRVDKRESLSAELANNYHIASMYAARYEYIKSLNDKDKLAKFREEFNFLKKDVKKIMEKEGVDIYE